MQSTETSKRRVAIIGGGISGLAAAWELQTQEPDTQVTLYESQPRLGGVIETRTIAGHVVECGPDSILRRAAEGRQLCREVGIENELIGTNPAARGVYTVHHGRLVRVPDGLASMAPTSRWQMATMPLLSLTGKLRMLKESRIPGRPSTLGDESLADFATRRFGREVFERIVQPLAGGIFMGDPQRLSLPACFPQFAEMEARHGSLIRATRANRSSSNGQPPGESVFITPQQGLGRLVDVLHDQMSKVEFRLGTTVESVRRTGEGWQLVAGGGRESTFDALIIATPVRHTAALLSSVDQALSDLLAGIDSSNSAIAIVAARREDVAHRLDGTGFVVPHVERRLSAACTFSSEKYLGRAPDGEVTFRVFMGGSEHPEVIDWTDEKIVSTALGELRALVGLSADPLWTHVARWPKSMPQYELGHLDRVAQIEQRMSNIPGLELAGNAYRGVGIPYCIRSGREAARRSCRLMTTR